MGYFRKINGNQNRQCSSGIVVKCFLDLV